MTNQEIAIAFSEISDQLKKDPETALVKYAKENNLAPAILEKMAQVFNTAQVIHHNAKVGNRGAERANSIYTLDAHDLAVKYAMDTPRGSFKEKLAPTAAEIPLGVITPTHSSADELFNLLTGKRAAPEPVKEASIGVEQASTEDLEMAFLSQYSPEEVLQEVENVYHQKSAEFMKKASDLMLTLYNTGRLNDDLALPDMPEILDDLHPRFEKAALEGCVLRLKRNLPTFNFPDQIEYTKKAFSVATHDAAEDVAELVQLHCALEHYGALREASKSAHAVETQRRRSPSSKESPQRPGRPPGPDNTPRPARPAVNYSEEVLPILNVDKETGDFDVQLTNTPVTRGLERFTKDTNDLREDLRRAMGLSETGSVIEGLGEKSRKNDEAAARSEKDTSRTLHLRQLMRDDDVLREAEPEKVVEYYNAIANTFPNVSEDIERTRMILREAVSYGGVPLASLGTLAKMEKDLKASF